MEFIYFFIVLKLNMKLLLQHKILFGYLICIVVIGSMVAILLHERSRVLQIET